MSKILVIKDSSRVQTKVKGSKFIASASPVLTVVEAEEFLATIKQEFYNATHNVYAWRLNNDEPQEYCNDDGEPSGSSGPPILNAIKGFDLTNIIVVVTRFFGGTKLGIGGLVRAYGEAAQCAIQAVKIVEMVLLQEISFEVPYDFIGNVSNYVSSSGLTLHNIEYKNTRAKISLLLPKDTVDDYLKKFKNLVKGNMKEVNLGPEEYQPLKN